MFKITNQKPRVRSSRPEVFSKNVFLKVSQNLQETRVSFLIKLQAVFFWIKLLASGQQVYLKRDWSVVLLWTLWNFYGHLFYITPLVAVSSDSLTLFWRSSCPEVFCEKVFSEISQNSQESTCVRASFLMKLQTLQLY